MVVRRMMKKQMIPLCCTFSHANVKELVGAVRCNNVKKFLKKNEGGWAPFDFGPSTPVVGQER